MRVSDVRTVRQGQVTELSAAVNDFRMWYRIQADHTVPARGDAFVAVALLPAMLEGGPLEVDPDVTVSGKLLQGIERLQDIFHCWNPIFKRIQIRATVSPATTSSPETASFFSGGVDGTFTALKHAEITRLVLINGFDFFLEPQVFAQVAERTRGYAASLGKTLLTVETNYREFNAAFGVSGALHHGSSLAAIALGLGFRRVYIPASFTYTELTPWGSHPLTDPLFSSEATEIVHDGAEAARTEKTQTIFACESVSRNLRVCWDDMNRNCGRCGKCLRTRIALRALGISAPVFEDLRSLDEIMTLGASSWGERTFLEDNMRFAERRGDHELARVLRRPIRKFELRRLAVEADRLLLGGLFKGIYRRFVTPERLRPGPAPDPNYPA